MAGSRNDWHNQPGRCRRAGVNGVDSAVYGGLMAEHLVAVGVVPDDLDDKFRACLEMRAAGPDLDGHLGRLTGLDGLDGAVRMERSLGPAPCLVEFSVGTAKPSLCHTIVDVAAVAIERHYRTRWIMLADHDEHVQVCSLVSADPDRQSHAAGDFSVFGESEGESDPIRLSPPWHSGVRSCVGEGAWLWGQGH